MVLNRYEKARINQKKGHIGMNILTADKQKREQLGDLLPQAYLRQQELILVAEQEKLPLGVIAMSKREDRFVIDWLYVQPEERGKGYGGALLDASCCVAARSGTRWLETNIYAQDENRQLLLAMLSARSFFLTHTKINRVCVSDAQMKQAVIFTDPAYDKPLRGSHAQVISLKHVDEDLLQQFLTEEKLHGNDRVAGADFITADRSLSQVLVDQGRIKGIALVNRMGGERAVLTFCYVDKTHRKEVVMLFHALAHALFTQGTPIRQLVFYYTDAAVERLVDHLLPEKEKTFEKRIVAQRWMLEQGGDR